VLVELAGEFLTEEEETEEVYLTSNWRWGVALMILDYVHSVYTFRTHATHFSIRTKNSVLERHISLSLSGEQTTRVANV
jgi:hypothetical protein